MKLFQCRKCKRCFQETEPGLPGSVVEFFPSEPDEVFYDHTCLADVDDPAQEERETNAPLCPKCHTKLALCRHVQHEKLPAGAKLAGTSPEFTEKTIPDAILHRHMAPKGKCGYLVVHKGKLQFVWEDTQEVFDADCKHPIVIAPERYHHVRITGPVAFQIEFYAIPTGGTADPDAIRPGETYTA
ncbi:MAG: DUF1971 domain-containing protein [Victivallaceae bacterium]|nr:DUF1971 domain-containing protein [Victivallaceae bacterium]